MIVSTYLLHSYQTDVFNPFFSGSGTNILNMDNYTTLIEKRKLLSQYVFGFPFGFLGYRWHPCWMAYWHFSAGISYQLHFRWQLCIFLVLMTFSKDLSLAFLSKLLRHLSLAFFYFCLSNFTYKLGKDFELLQTIVKP